MPERGSGKKNKEKDWECVMHISVPLLREEWPRVQQQDFHVRERVWPVHGDA